MFDGHTEDLRRLTAFPLNNLWEMRYKINPLSEQELRSRARNRFRIPGTANSAGQPETDVPRLLEDLAVSKIELEMQNEHLQETRSKVEMALKQSSELFDFSPVAFFRLDAKGIILKSNLVASKMLEMDRTHLVEKPFDQFIVATQRDQMHTLMERASHFGVNEHCELVLLEAGLAARHVQADLAPLAPGQGFLLTLIDITERIRLEHQLRDDEQRWKFALDAAGDGVWDWNVQTGCVKYSSKLLQLFGYGVDEFSGTLDAWRNLLHPEDQSNFLLTMQACLSGTNPRFSIEQRVLCKDGSYKWILCRGAVFSAAQDGTAKRLIGTHVDITGRKQMELHFQKMSGLHQAAFDSLPSRVAVLDNDGLVLQTNAALNAHLQSLAHGYASEDGLIGTHYARIITALIGSQPDIEQEAMDAVSEVIKGVRPGYELEYALSTDSVEQWFLMNVTPIRDGTARAAVSLQDITQIHKDLGQSLDEAHFLRVAEAELSRAVRYGHPLMMLCLGLDPNSYTDARPTLMNNLVRIIQGLLRSADILGRAQQDTLEIVLPNTAQDGGETLASRIVSNVSACPIDVNGRLVYLSVSIGARQRFQEASYAALQARAQVALQLARDRGGNGVVLDTAGSPCLW